MLGSRKQRLANYAHGTLTAGTNIRKRRWYKRRTSKIARRFDRLAINE